MLVVNSQGDSLLEWASANSCLPMVRLLMEKGAAVSQLAFYAAIAHVDPAMLECFLSVPESAGFVNDAVTLLGSQLYPALSSARPYLFHIVTRCGRDQDIPQISIRSATLLIEAKVNPAMIADDQDMPLHHTTHPAMASLLVEQYHVPVNPVDRYGDTPLGNLVRYILTGVPGPEEIKLLSQTIQLLITNGGDVNYRIWGHR